MLDLDSDGSDIGFWFG